MTIIAKSVDEYLAQLPEDRRATIDAIRQAIIDNLQPGFEHGMQYNMPSFYVPHSVYPSGYHCDPKQPLPFAAVGNQKNHIGIYLFCVYTDEESQKRFVDAWNSAGKKLDMGKSCIRIKKLEDVPLEVLGNLIIGITVDDFVGNYELAREAWKKSK